MARISRRTRGPQGTTVGFMNSSQIAYTFAAISVIVALMLVLRGFLGSGDGRSRRGHAAYTDSRYEGDRSDRSRPSRRGRSLPLAEREPRRPMTDAEWQCAREGQRELSVGRGIFDAAGMPGAPQEQGKLAEARGHLQVAQDRFSQIAGETPPSLEAAIEECNRLLNQCNRRTILRVAE